MVRRRSQNGEQSTNGQGRDLATILANIQQRLEEHAILMQQQSVVIQTLQQQQMNGGAGNGGPGNGGVRNEGFGIGENPIEEGHGPERGLQPEIERQEPLYK